MKKNLLFLAILGSVSLTAQPTHSFTFNESLYGTSSSVHVSNYVDPGSPGANQVWDFSNYPLSQQPMEGIFENPAETPYGLQYPDADLSLSVYLPQGSQFVYYEYRPDGLHTIGAEIEGFLSQPYSNSRRDLATPLTYLDSYSDSAYFQSITASSTGNAASDYFVEVDGYGTLITPDGTYENVLRLHSIETTDFSFNAGGSTTIFESYIESYFWIIDEFPLPLLTTFEQYLDGNLNQQGSRILSGLTVSLEKSNRLEGVSLFPVPAVDFVTLDLGNNQISEAVARLYDSNGRLIKSFQLISGEQQSQIEVNDLAAGFYSLQVIADEGSITKHFIK